MAQTKSNQINENYAKIFSSVDSTKLQTPFLLDKSGLRQVWDSVKVAQTQKNPDTQNFMTASRIEIFYDFFRQSAIKYQNMPTRQSIDKNIIDHKTTNTVAIQLLHVKYDQISQKALDKGFITIDTAKQLLKENASQGLYETQEAFFASTSTEVIVGNEFRFTIPQNLFLQNTNNLTPNFIVEMGNCAPPIYTKLNTVFKVKYATKGFKKVTITMQTAQGKSYKTSFVVYVQQKVVENQTAYSFVNDENSNEKGFLTTAIPNGTGINPCDIDIPLGTQGDEDFLIAPDMSVGGLCTPNRKAWAKNNGTSCGTGYVFLSCDKVFDKPVIIIEAYDEKNNRGYENQMKIFRPFMIDLMKRGYDVILLDFDQNWNFIQNNGAVFRELLSRVSKQTQTLITVIGQSMGGQIARYELALMESENLRHGVQTYISLDSPHQGAFVPTGLQWTSVNLKESLDAGMIRTAPWGSIRAMLHAKGYGWLVTLTEDTYEALASPAAQQMLKENVTAQQALPITANVNYFEFQRELKSLGYPEQYYNRSQKIQNIAIVNGELSGRRPLDFISREGKPLLNLRWKFEAFSAGICTAYANMSNWVAFDKSTVSNNQHLITHTKLNNTGWCVPHLTNYENYIFQNATTTPRPAYELSAGSYYPTQQQIKINLTRIISQGAELTFYDNIDRHTFIPSGSAIDFRHPTLDINSQEYLNFNIAGADYFDSNFPNAVYQEVKDAGIIQFDEIHQAAKLGDEEYNTIQLGNIAHLSADYMLTKKFKNKYFPPNRIACLQPVSPRYISVKTDDEEGKLCKNMNYDFNTNRVSTATSYEWTFAGTIEPSYTGTNATYGVDYNSADTTLEVKVRTYSGFTGTYSNYTTATFDLRSVNDPICSSWYRAEKQQDSNTQAARAEVEEKTAKADIVCYPNPVENVLHIDIKNHTIQQIMLCDVLGTVISLQKGTTQTIYSFDMNNHAAGVYFIRVLTETGTISKKIILTK